VLGTDSHRHDRAASIPPKLGLWTLEKKSRKLVMATRASAEMAERCTYVTGGYAAKKYWNAGRAALRRSAGTMRFDLNIIASSKSGPARKETMKQNKQFLMDLDNFDLAMAKKDTAAALAAFAKVKEGYNKIAVA